jgi:hypothetical protein
LSTDHVVSRDQFENAATFQNYQEISPQFQMGGNTSHTISDFAHSSNENLGALVLFSQPASEEFTFGRTPGFFRNSGPDFSGDGDIQFSGLVSPSGPRNLEFTNQPTDIQQIEWNPVTTSDSTPAFLKIAGNPDFSPMCFPGTAIVNFNGDQTFSGVAAPTGGLGFVDSRMHFQPNENLPLLPVPLPHPLHGPCSAGATIGEVQGVPKGMS